MLLLLCRPGLSETRETRLLVPGLVYVRLVRENPPLQIHILEIAPNFSGRIEPALATDVVPGLEPLSALAARRRPLAAVNGGYFVMVPEDGTPGDLAGLSVIRGQIVSEAVNERTCLLWRAGRRPRVAQLSTRLNVNGHPLQGRNRTPGRVRSQGADGRAKHDFTRHTTGEVIQFLPAFGPITPPGAQTEVVLDSANCVKTIRRGPGPIPRDGSVLAGDAPWLRKLEGRLRIEAEVLENGRTLRLQDLNVINGGPCLVKDGKVHLTESAEGFSWLPHFGPEPNPRTLAGVTADGRLLLVVVDGRNPDVSVGLTLQQSAELLLQLGAVEGVNLDGGGSSTMVIDGSVVNRPSDPSGERPIGDAILLYSR